MIRSAHGSRETGIVKTLLAGVLVLVALTVIALLYRGGEPTPSCVIADTVELIETHTADGASYSLYRIVSGVTDKIEVLQLFDQPVTFDSCGEPSIEAVASQMLDYGPEDGPQQQWIERVTVDAARISVDYSNVETGAWSVEWRERP